ncbi:Protein of unknown function [Gryllus bimaculatus]|nr:Protein of unknown function [Gryllus bimaculatus]
MSESWKRTVTSVSDKLFPGLAFYHPYAEDGGLHLGNQIVSDLPLQMSLYFNIVFYPFWLVSSIVMLSLKYECLTSMYRFLVVTIFVFVIVVECLRLYLGYVGNLNERIPELAGFWMLSVLLQLPLQLFLFINENTLPQPLDRIMQLIMIIMLLIQLFTGFKALRTAARYQANRFHIMKFQLVSESKSDLDLRLKSE